MQIILIILLVGAASATLFVLIRGVVGLANNQTPLENAAFPIFKDERGGFKELKAGDLGVVKGACQDAIDMIVALKPYQGGNDALWRLHRLNATDKHRVLLTAGAGWSSVTMSPVLPAGTEQIPFLHLNWSKKAFFPLEDSTEKQLEFFRAMSHVPVEMKFELSFDVTFREPEVVEAEPVLPTLVQLSDYVEGVVRSFGPLL